MGILSKKKIIEEMDRNNIIISPPQNNQQIERDGVLIHMSNELRVFRKARQVIKITEDTHPDAVTESVIVPEGDFFLLTPGETVTAFSQEKITLCGSMCAWLLGRGRFTRMGLLVEVASGFIHPGIKDKTLFFQITNASGLMVALYPGVAICQLVFQPMEGEDTYEGTFKNIT